MVTLNQKMDMPTNTPPTPQLIYIQPYQKSADQILAVLNKRLKEEEHFEDVTKLPSYRADLLRSLLKEINEKP